MSEHTWSQAQYQIMQAEHDELQELLDRCLRLVGSTPSQRKHVDLLVSQLSELVENHFRHEEKGGYLKVAVERAPRLSPRAEALREQHDLLQEEIDKLRMLVHSGVESPSWWARIREDLRQFAQRLHSHEEAENDLVQEAFNDDIGVGD